MCVVHWSAVFDLANKVFFFFWGIFPFWGTGCCGLSADWIAMFQSQLWSRWILIKVYLDKVLVIYRDPYEGLGYSCIFFHPLSFVNFVVWQTLTRFGPHCCSPLKRVSGPHKSCSSLSWQPNMWSFIVFLFFFFVLLHEQLRFFFGFHSHIFGGVSLSVKVCLSEHVNWRILMVIRGGHKKMNQIPI